MLGEFGPHIQIFKIGLQFFLDDTFICKVVIALLMQNSSGAFGNFTFFRIYPPQWAHSSISLLTFIFFWWLWMNNIYVMYVPKSDSIYYPSSEIVGSKSNIQKNIWIWKIINNNIKKEKKCIELSAAIKSFMNKFLKCHRIL